MKNVLLLFSQASIDRAQAEPKSLERLLLQELPAPHTGKMAISHAVYSNLVHIISADKAAIIDIVTGKDIADFNLIYQRRWQDVPDQAKACATYLTHKNIPNIDREAYVTASKNKLTQMWQLWEAGLPIPATAYASSEAGARWLVEHVDALPFGFPMVAKGVNATRGQHNFLVNTAAELATVFTDHPTMAFLVQEFLPNDGDYRVLVCGDKAQLVMHRQATQGRHTNNTSQGGQATLVGAKSLSPAILDDCVRAAHVFNRDFAGVDVVISNGKHYFFEVNRAPQIESGQFVSDKAAVLAGYLFELAQ